MPLKRGYSRATLDHNIRDMRAHHPLAEALGAAYSIAREAWRKRHPREAYPAYLRPEHQQRHQVELQAADGKARRTRTRARTAARRMPRRAPRHAARKNPIRRTGATDLYTGFHGEPPKKFTPRTFDDMPDEIWQQGDVVAIAYKTRRDGKTVVFEHEFRPKSRPKLCISPDGKRIFLIDGKYKVTDRGIEDR